MMKSELLAPSMEYGRGFVMNLVHDMEEHIKQKYDLDEFKVKSVVSFSENRVRSWGGTRGGEPSISVVAYPFLEKIPGGPNSDSSYEEYKFLENDPELCSVQGCWKKCLATVVAHEVAHALHWYADAKTALEKLHPNFADDSRPHGEMWRILYRDLRNKFVNHTDYMGPYVIEPRQPRKIKRKLQVISREKDGGRYVTYKYGGKVLGKFFSMWRHPIQRYDPDRQVWVSLNTMKLVEARRWLMEEHEIS